MKKILRTLLLLVSISLAGMTVAGFCTRHLQRLWSIHVKGIPVLELSPSLDLGECEFGRTVEAPFTVANRGQRDLVLDKFRSNCACNSIEGKEDGKSVFVHELQLSPGQEANLVLKMVARARVGQEVNNVVYFCTNDPLSPEASFVARMKVTGGITVAPTSVLFGIVPIGSEARQLLQVHDNAIRSRTIKRVESSNPNRFSVRLLPGGTRAKASKPENRVLLGHIEVTLNSKEIGLVSGEVQIFLDDGLRPPDSVPVSGRVAPAVEASPSTVLLPRESSSGPLYFATCVCRSTSGQPFTLALENTPPHISVTISPPGKDPSVQLVRIDWDSVNTKSASLFVDNKVKVRLRARIGKEQILVEIPVKLRMASLR